jgi:hypothetical protein
MKHTDRKHYPSFLDDDEGTLEIRMGIDPGDPEVFIISFGKDLSWIGMTKEEAFNFARAIMHHVVDKVIAVETPDGT